MIYTMTEDKRYKVEMSAEELRYLLGVIFKLSEEDIEIGNSRAALIYDKPDEEVMRIMSCYEKCYGLWGKKNVKTN